MRAREAGVAARRDHEPPHHAKSGVGGAGGGDRRAALGGRGAKGEQMKTGRVIKTGHVLAVWLFAVTALLGGGWAQESTQEQGPSLAQNYPAGPNGEQEPQNDTRSEGPAPAVARISLIFGDVSTQRGDTGDWSVTSINAPVVRGDQVATGDKSRTEVQLDFANII